MSDQPEQSRPASESAGGWFVPKNAMTEQELAASKAAAPDSPPDMPANTPEQSGAWYVPPEAADRVAALIQTGDTVDVFDPNDPSQPLSANVVTPSGDGVPSPYTPTAEAPVAAKASAPDDLTHDLPVEVAPSAASAASDLPAGAAVSSEADYSNYIPGRGFVSAEEAARLRGETESEAAVPTAAQNNVLNVQPGMITPEVETFDETPVDRKDPSETVDGSGAPDAAATSVQSDTPTESQDPASIYMPSSEAVPAAVMGETEPAPADAEPVSEPVAAVAPVAAEPAPEPAAKPVNEELVQRYVDVEKSVQVLRRKYNAGTLTRSQLQEELRKLMILDEDGYWWMIGLESDKWYKYDGKDWVPAPRPGKAEANPAVAASTADPLSRVSTAGVPPAAPSNVPSVEDTPLPKRVPLMDPGATMVGMSAPRLDNTLKAPLVGAPATSSAKSEPEKPAASDSGTAARFFERASQSGAKPASGFDGGVTMPSGTSTGGGFDGGVTVPSASVDVTQPGIAVSANSIPSAYPPSASGTGGASPRLQPGEQPDYGLPPSGMLADRQRSVGCIVQAAVAAFFLSLVGALIVVGLSVLGYFSVIQSYDAKIANLATAATTGSQSARIFDVNGRQLYQINDPNLGARIQVPLNQISPYVIAATVGTEDQRYYKTPGFDAIGIVRAVLQNLRAGGTVSGASGITQQLTRALVLDPGAAQDRSSSRKINEIIVSSELARRYTKNQILEYYLNQAYYGNLAYGIEAAAQTYFGKSAKNLNLAESAFLVGLVQSPAGYDPIQYRQKAMDRMDDVLRLMVQNNCIQMEHAPYDQGEFCVTQADVDAAAVQIAQVKSQPFRPPANTAIYPHFVNFVQQQLEAKFGQEALYTSGFNIYTTIDPKVQDLADASVKQQLAALKGLNVTNGAVLAMRPSDGAILAMVGSADFNNKDIGGQFNVTLASRQPGSSIKPFVYLASMERDANNNYFTPASLLWDVPTCFGSAPGYCPVNYDSKFHGPQTVRAALSNSYNIPAVKTLQFVGVDRFKEFALRVGLTFPLTQPEQAGLPMALGGVEVPMIDMVTGYGAIANSGKRVDPYSIAKITRKTADGSEEVVFEAKPQEGTQVIEPALAYLMTNILSDNQARQPAFGNALTLSDGRPAAVKTGTTNDYKDNWTIGFTPQLVIGVWVGNSNNSPMRGTSGVTGAAPIWKQVMVGALQGQPIMQFQPPDKIGQTTICADFGTQDFPECKNRRTEIFFAPNPPPAAADIVKTIPVDTFSGLIANANCPDFVENRTFLAFNDASAEQWLNNDPAGQQWAKDHGLTTPISSTVPTQQCDANTPRPQVVITSPAGQQTVNGLVEIRGSVYVPNFSGYQLQIGQGFNATQFQPISNVIKAQPSAENSLLGSWDSTTMPDGPYTLQLVAQGAANQLVKRSIPIILNNSAAPIGQPTPIVVPGFATATPDPFGQGGGNQGFPTPIEQNPTPIIIDPNPVVPTATTDPNAGQGQPIVQPTATEFQMFPNTPTP